ncbi:melatonin receptor type 1B-B [Nematostella vectensis]|uniref:melatonin receptor type 1B-B n=1 Tax=Nematostella vectensis TaxID=45351 RepID=UPI002077125E|nr:melatonin receptor type 1B-B [Nematostella vectensis]
MLMVTVIKDIPTLSCPGETLETMKSTENFRMEMEARSTALVVIETSILLLITVSTLLGNLMVCWAVYNSKTLRTVANIYIIVLAICDILMGVLCMPLSLEVFITACFKHGYNVVQFQGFFSFFLSLASLQTMTATAVNRYLKIVKPEHHRKYCTMKATLITILVTFVLAGSGASLPLIGGFADYMFHYGKVFSYINYYTNTAAYIYTILLKIVYITVPTLISLFCYYKIFTTVKAHAADMESNRGAGRGGMNVEEIRISKVLFATVLGFVLCWTPVAIIDMIDTFSDYSLVSPRQIYLFYIYMGYGSSAINPWIYGILNKSFRREFLKLLRLRFHSSPGSEGTSHVENSAMGATSAVRTAYLLKITKVSSIAPSSTT